VSVGLISSSPNSLVIGTVSPTSGLDFAQVGDRVRVLHGDARVVGQLGAVQGHEVQRVLAAFWLDCWNASFSASNTSVTA